MSKRRPRYAWMLVATTAVAGCVGSIGDRPPPSMIAADGAIVAPTPDASMMEPPLCTAPSSLPTYMRRLSRAEYVSSLRVVFGDAPSAVGAQLPDNTEVNGFDTNAESSTLGRTRSEQYRDAARTVAEWVIDAARRDTIVGCNPSTGGAECLRSYAQRVGPIAFRRPLETEELDALVRVGMVAMGDPNPYMAARLVTQAILRSPSFVYVVERGTPVSDHGDGSVKLTSYEMATRLSYLILRTTPSAALLEAAGRGELDTAEGVARHATQMLALAEARPALRDFFAGWLRLNKLQATDLDITRYPEFSPTLRASMREETLRLVDDLVWRDGGDLREIFTARYTFVNNDMARVYGMPAGGADWRRVDFGGDSQRSGILTQPGTLSMNSADHGVLTIIRRGVWALDVFLCDKVRPPEGGVPPLPMTMMNQSERSLLAAHRADPACSSCHNRIDPMGLGLSGYNEIGAVRMVDTYGQPVDTSGTVPDIMGGMFSGPVQLGALLHDHPSVPRCMARQLFRYAFARGETDADQCAIKHMERSLRDSNFSFRAMLIAMVQTEAFRFRAAPSVTEGE